MKKIILDVLNSKVRITDVAIEAGDSGSVGFVVENVPYEWKSGDVWVYALFKRGQFSQINRLEEWETDVPSGAMADNNAFKTVVFAVKNTEEEGKYTYRYVASPVWVRVGEGLSGTIDAEVIPDRERIDAIATLLAAMQKNTEKVDGIEEGAEVNVQSDWGETNEDSDSFIKNKPTIDQSYNPDSANAQSGKAVSDAVDKAVRDATEKIISGSPEALDTLNELATALGNDENFATTVMTEIGKKTDYNEFLDKTTGLHFAIEALKNYGAGNGFESITVKGSYTSFKDFIDGIGTPGTAIKLKSDNADSDGFLFQSYNENQSEIDGFAGTTKFLLDMDGRMYKRRYSRFPSEPEHDWEEIVTEAKIASTIEDTLESIITKYGLGGESV
jgi:hypothetical protein